MVQPRRPDRLSGGRVRAAPAEAAAPAAYAVSGPGGLVLSTEAGRFDGRVSFSVLVRAKLPAEASGALLARMEPGKDFHYTLKAEMVRDGQAVAVNKRVPVRAGQEKKVVLEFPPADPAGE